jgi:hypothetical protein
VDYVFEFRAVGRGEAEAPYGLGGNVAKHEAKERAKEHLRLVLAEKVHSVPCPTCMMFQPNMCRVLTDEKYSWMNLTAACLLSCAVTGATLAIGAEFKPEESFIAGNTVAIIVAIVVAALTALAGAAFLIARRHWSREYDPNTAIPLEKRKSIAADNRAMLLSEFQVRYPEATATPFRST